jgi:hypothetical protein
LIMAIATADNAPAKTCAGIVQKADRAPKKPAAATLTPAMAMNGLVDRAPDDQSCGAGEQDNGHVPLAFAGPGDAPGDEKHDDPREQPWNRGDETGSYRADLELFFKDGWHEVGDGPEASQSG